MHVFCGITNVLLLKCDFPSNADNSNRNISGSNSLTIGHTSLTVHL